VNRFLLPAEADQGSGAAHFAWPTRGTIGLGLLCFIALMGEGAVIDWAAIHLRDTYQLNNDAAGLGYAVFAGAMATIRFAGDRLRTRFGAVTLVRASAGVTLIGMLGALFAPSAQWSVVGYGLAGLGIGNLAPVLFAGGGRREPDNPARGIAAVTTLGYAGFLAGPPLIGLIGRAMGLPLALGVIVIGMTVIALAAQAAARADG
jgi:MFS family permease